MVPPLEDGGYLSPEAELDALVTAFPDVGFILDSDGKYVQVLSSPDSEELLYDDPEALLGERIEDAFDDRKAERIMSNVERALETGEVRTFEYALDVGDGERWFEGRVAPVGGEAYDHVVYVARDVTARRRRERELARQRGYMQAMLDSLDDLFYALDRDGNLVDWNRTVETVTGYEGEELAGCGVTELFEGDATERLATFVAEVFEQGSARRVTEVQPRSGGPIPYEFVAALFDDPDGEDLVVGVGRDVSERREREEQVRVFGRVLRHNMRNKMTVVDGTAEFLERRDPAGVGGDAAAAERIRSAARDLMQLTEKAHDATEVLLREHRRGAVDVDAVVAGVVEEFGVRAGETTVSYDGDDDATARAIPAIEQAVEELVENAVQHGGESSGASSVRVAVDADGDTVTVLVSDDGPGLPDHEANIVTERREISPVFHASGMGLWLVRWIVRRSRGEVDIVERGPDGTTIEIALPRTDRDAGDGGPTGQSSP
ncbi:PAS domain-containing protein [Halosimplex pelagicum]|uniref:histidine kinase n=1 Tax=Halosimplex pelagicum TaxID=869886 RepID=A0A7D5T5Z0_9EURY|nr:PAS domain-containing sensor histidine kinase [Halosimplex pelagicum]QLH82768.1 PAS domain-containing sensor histidine kinase [Halosimplex pelagicum]